MIRDFILQDKQELLEMVTDFYNSTAVSHPIPVENFERCFDEIINQSPFVRGLSILHDGKLLGYAQLSFTYSSEAGGLVLLFEELYIKAEARGKGIAHQVFEFIEKEYQHTVKRYRLECCKCNEKAFKLYTKLGYTCMDYIQMVKE